MLIRSKFVVPPPCHSSRAAILDGAAKVQDISSRIYVYIENHARFFNILEFLSNANKPLPILLTSHLKATEIGYIFELDSKSRIKSCLESEGTPLTFYVLLKKVAFFRILSATDVFPLLP